VRFQRTPEHDDIEPRWIVCAYIGEGFLDLRIGLHRWRLHLT
jgi:hypothetical protein